MGRSVAIQPATLQQESLNGQVAVALDARGYQSRRTVMGHHLPFAVPIGDQHGRRAVYGRRLDLETDLVRDVLTAPDGVAGVIGADVIIIAIDCAAEAASFSAEVVVGALIGVVTRIGVIRKQAADHAVAAIGGAVIVVGALDSSTGA